MTHLRWTTAGESHGKALVGIVEGIPSGLALSVERVDAELARRQGGYGRASARETAMRTALGAAARQVLEHFGIEIFGHVVELGGIGVDALALERAFAAPRSEREALREKSPFFALDPAIETRLTAHVDAAKERGDTLGGIFEVRALGLPPGLGSYASGGERLTARIGGALFSIPAMKGVEFGLGFETARRPGSEAHDGIQSAAGGGTGSRYARTTNRAGGLEGGMTTGEPLVVRTAMKPIPTLRRGLPTVEFETLAPTPATYQRSDVTSVPAASVVGEAVVGLELAAAFLGKFGGDSMDQLAESLAAYRAKVAVI